MLNIASILLEDVARVATQANARQPLAKIAADMAGLVVARGGRRRPCGTPCPGLTDDGEVLACHRPVRHAGPHEAKGPSGVIQWRIGPAGVLYFADRADGRVWS
jgi:hypothetical protein